MNSQINIHLLAKPSGPLCNLNCEYCFYLEKEEMFDKDVVNKWFMSDDITDQYIKQYIDAQAGDVVSFGFQGGEPTLIGLEYYKRLVKKIEKKLPANKEAQFSLQTNGTLLNDEWVRFLKDNNFLVGVSVDGPEEIHDAYRKTKGGGATFTQVMDGIDVLKKYNVDFNTLTSITNRSSKCGKEVYSFLKKINSRYMQFIPIVERWKSKDKELASPPDLKKNEPTLTVPDWVVRPLGFGKFYKDIFDVWVRQDVGKYFVQYFDTLLSLTLGHPSPICTQAETCGAAGVIEHNGDVFACDHFVYPEYKLGNIKNSNIVEMFSSEKQVAFGNSKKELLPKFCRECSYLSLCNGGCIKHRFLTTVDGNPGLNYLCEGYRLFFEYSKIYFIYMADLFKNGKHPSGVMDYAKTKNSGGSVKLSRNSICPCGSGKKYKNCCLGKDSL